MPRRRARSSPAAAAEVLPDVQKSALVPRLVEQRVRVERQIAELSATLLPAHPRMKQLNAELAGLNRQIRAEVEKIVDGLEREAKVAALREDGVRRRIDEAKKRVVSAGGDDVKLRALESLAKSKRAEFERLQTQLEAARTTSDAAGRAGRGADRLPRQTVEREGLAQGGHDHAAGHDGDLAAGAGRSWSRASCSPWPGKARPPPATATFAAPARTEAHRPSATPALARPYTARTLPSVARHLIAKAQGRAGFRTLVAGEAAGTSAGRWPSSWRGSWRGSSSR